MRFLAAMFTFLVILGALPVPAAEPEAHGPTLTRNLAPGEALADVARRYGVAEDVLRQANPGLASPAEGSVVVVPPPARGWPRHAVSRGETLWALAKRYDVPLEELVALNGLAGDRLEVGQVLLIPRAGLPPAPPPAWLAVALPDGRKGWVPGSAVLLPAEEPRSPEELLALAWRLAGTPYRWGGEDPDGVDCSGFVQEVCRMAGHPLPRLADEQFSATRPVERDELRPGDLVFFSTYLPGPSHVGIYLGEGRFLHASSSRGVTEDRLDGSYFASRFLGGRRLPAWQDPEPVTALPPGP